MVKGVIVLALVVALGGGGWLAFKPSSNSEGQRIDIVPASTISFEITATGNGDLRARKQTVLRSELEQNAAIVEVVEEGSRVSKGDVLVRLNADEIQTKLDDELLQLESAKSELVGAENAYQIQVSDNESALRQALLKVELNELELRKWQEGEVKEQRTKLQLDAERAEREESRLKAKLERSRELFTREFLSKDELDRDELAYVEAASALQTTQLAQRVYEEFTYERDLKQKTSDVEESNAELERVQRRNESELASKDAARTNRRRQFELREERVAKMRKQIEAAVIKAPTDGLVVYATSLNQNMWNNENGTLEVGTEIRPNQEIIVLPDTTEMMAVVRIPEALMGRVRPGQNAVVTIDAALGKKYSGTVETIGVMAQSGGWRDPNVREYEVRIGLDMGAEAHGLKPSMRCEARLTLNTVEQALAVPIQAVFNEGRRQFVYTAQDAKYHQKPVRIGRRSDLYAEIVEGIAEGDRVLLRQPPTAQIVKAEEPKQGAPSAPGAAPASNIPAQRGGPPQPRAEDSGGKKPVAQTTAARD
ncbi:MAG TPA: hypothetical protein DEB06_02955 [Phycisphaerales bacterium]|nr:hypothetical protein [Phycisphaerales bacterium]